MLSSAYPFGQVWRRNGCGNGLWRLNRLAADGTSARRTPPCRRRLNGPNYADGPTPPSANAIFAILPLPRRGGNQIGPSAGPLLPAKRFRPYGPPAGRASRGPLLTSPGGKGVEIVRNLLQTHTLRSISVAANATEEAAEVKIKTICLDNIAAWGTILVDGVPGRPCSVWHGRLSGTSPLALPVVTAPRHDVEVRLAFLAGVFLDSCWPVFGGAVESLLVGVALRGDNGRSWQPPTQFRVK